MNKIKRLKRMADILWNHFDDEIMEDRDWYYATRFWEFNFTLDDSRETIVAYKRKGSETNWSDYVVVSERIREWKEVI